VREVLRRKGTPYEELGLDDPKWTDGQLIGLMVENPILINRPIVMTPRGVRLCRPASVVLEILPNAPSANGGAAPAGGSAPVRAPKKRSR
jgi:arsenate reductase